MKAKRRILTFLLVSCVALAISVVLATDLQAADASTHDSVEITFRIPEREVTITEAETLYMVNLIEFTIKLTSTDTGFTPASNMETVWYRNGTNEGWAWGTNLGNIEIDPTNPDRLAGRAFGVSLHPGHSYMGDWHVRVYIEEYFIGASEPVRVIVVPAPQIDLSQARVSFNIPENEITVIEEDSMPFIQIEYMIDLVSVNTSLTPRTSVRVELHINGELGIKPIVHSLQWRDIEPTNPNRLSTPYQSPGVSFFAIRIENAGDWTVRVYVANQFMGESDPVRVNILPIPPRTTEPIAVSFNIFSNVVYAIEGASQFDSVMETTIDLVSAETGLSPLTSFHFEWMLDGEYYRILGVGRFNNHGINPSNPDQLAGEPFDIQFHIPYVSEQHQGLWTLRVFIYGHLIAESSPIQVYVLPPIPFTDINTSDWFYRDVAFVYQQGLMVGVAPGRFNPHAPLTRAMVAQVLFNMQSEPTTTGAGTSFTDVRTGRWYANAVAWAYENGLVSGFGDGTFRPSQHITRAHLTLLLANYAQAMGVSPPSMELEPHGNATRAELAAMLRSFHEGE